MEAGEEGGEGVDFALSEEHRAIVETVRSFVRRELVPHEDLVERLDEVPDDLAREIRGKAIAAGLYAANFPADLGGGGLDALSLTLAERELGWTSYALQALVTRPSNILQACQGDQVQTYLLPAIRGERHDCLAMTEPGAGSDVRSMTTTARRADGDWVINGTKHFISHADVADFVVLFAVTGTERARRRDRRRAPAGPRPPLGDIGVPRRPRHSRADHPPGTAVGLASGLPPLRAVVHRLPGARLSAARHRRPRVRPAERVARRQPAYRGGVQRRAGQARA